MKGLWLLSIILLKSTPLPSQWHPNGGFHLMDVSASRWGYARYPSPVWTDETDHQYMRERLPNVYQVFGHTQQESEPVITEQYACLDCRRAFLLTSEGDLIEAETTNKR